jgi:hypothetical protein
MTLVKLWHDQRSQVLTLNYDTLIERAARAIAADGKDGKNFVKASDVYGVPLTEASRRNAAIISSEDIETFRLMKLHGSINWYYSGATQYLGEAIYYHEVSDWTQTSKYERRGRAAVRDKVPLIVPPTTEKVTFFQHETLRLIWLIAGQQIEGATRLISIGYSLPETDLAMQFFLQSRAPKEPIDLVIVNRDSKTVDRYRRLLGSSFEVSQPFAGPSALQDFVECISDENGKSNAIGS